MSGWLVASYLALVGLAVGGSLEAWRVWRRYGLAFLRPFALYVALAFAHALVTFVGEVFGPAVIGPTIEARRRVYVLVDLVSIPLLGGTFVALFLWLKALLGRPTPRLAIWAGVAVAASYLWAFVAILIVVFAGGDPLVAAVGALALNAIIVAVAFLTVGLLLFGTPGSDEPYRLVLSRGLGRVYGVSLCVLGLSLLWPTAPPDVHPGAQTVLVPVLVFLLNVPALAFLRIRLARLPVPPVGPPADVAQLAELMRSAGISEREADVVRLVAMGLDNRGIGEKLFISPKTVKNHITSVYAKTGVRNRVQLANLVRRGADAD